MANCKDCVHNDMCYITHIDISVACSEFLDKNKYVEVVRCKDCKHYRTSGCAMDTYAFDVVEEGFCSYGERREGE